jgi:hypothetical protein
LFAAGKQLTRLCCFLVPFRFFGILKWSEIAMDTLEWGNYDEDLRDVEDFDLEQYGFQYDNSFTSHTITNFGDPVVFESMLNNETSMFYPQYFVKQEPKPFVRVKEEHIEYYQVHVPPAQPKQEAKRARISDELSMEVEGQPPVEVRTRTPSETRTFTVSAKVLGNWKKLGGCIMKITLLYEKNDQAEAELVVSDFIPTAF